MKKFSQDSQNLSSQEEDNAEPIQIQTQSRRSATTTPAKAQGQQQQRQSTQSTLKINQPSKQVEEQKQEENKKQLTEEEKDLALRNARKNKKITIDQKKFEEQLDQDDTHQQAIKAIFYMLQYMADPAIHFNQENDFLEFWGRDKCQDNDQFAFPFAQEQYWMFVMRNFKKQQSEAIPGESPDTFKVFSNLDMWVKENCIHFFDPSNKKWMEQLGAERKSNQQIKSKIFVLNPASFLNAELIQKILSKLKKFKVDREQQLKQENASKNEIENSKIIIQILIDTWEKYIPQSINNYQQGQDMNYYVKLFVFPSKDEKDVSIALVLMMEGIVADIAMYQLRYYKVSGSEGYYFTKHAKDIFSYIDKVEFEKKYPNNILDLMYAYSSARSLALLPNSFGTPATNEILKRCQTVFNLLKENQQDCNLNIDNFKAFQKTQYLDQRHKNEVLKGLGKRTERDDKGEEKEGEKRQKVKYTF